MKQQQKDVLCSNFQAKQRQVIAKDSEEREQYK